MAGVDNLKPFSQDDDRASQAGKKSSNKGQPHISTHIKNLLNDPDFSIDNWKNSGEKYKDVPIKAIITVAIEQSIKGDKNWAEWLAKHGYGTNIDITSGGEALSTALVEFIDGKDEDTDTE